MKKLFGLRRRWHRRLRPALRHCMCRQQKKQKKHRRNLARLQKHVRLAEQSGAEIVTTHSEDIALQIAEYARISEVTRIVIEKQHDEAGLFSSAKGVDRASDGSCA